VGRAWIAWLEPKPWALSMGPEARIEFVRDHGRARVTVDAPASTEVIMRETWDPGWRAREGQKLLKLQAKWGIFLSLKVEPGHHTIILEYDPLEVRAGLAISSASALLLILVLTGRWFL
jgi:uncharacterized membrane protein YfhO